MNASDPQPQRRVEYIGKHIDVEYFGEQPPATDDWTEERLNSMWSERYGDTPPPLRFIDDLIREQNEFRARSLAHLSKQQPPATDTDKLRAKLTADALGYEPATDDTCPDCHQKLSGDEMLDREVHGRCKSQGKPDMGVGVGAVKSGTTGIPTAQPQPATDDNRVVCPDCGHEYESPKSPIGYTQCPKCKADRYIKVTDDKQEWTVTKDSHFAYIKSEVYGSFMFPVSEFEGLQQVALCINAAIEAAYEKGKQDARL